MKSQLKKLKDCKVQLRVEVEPKLVESRFQEVLKDFQKEAKLSGFREGKVPTDIIEKKFSKEAHEEVLKSLISEAYQHSLSSHKVHPVSLPSISDIKMERGSSLTFLATFERFPDVSLKKYKGVKIRRKSLQVKPEDVEKALESLRHSRAEFVDVLEERPVQKSDFIRADVELWKENRFEPGQQGVLLSVEPNPSDDFFDKIVGARVEETREVTLAPSAADREKGLVGRQPMYRVTVRRIQKKSLPALDEAFCQQLGVPTPEALREAVRKDLARQKQTDSHEGMKQQLFQHLLNAHSFAVPEELVTKQKARLIEQAKAQGERMGMPPNYFEENKTKIEAEASQKAYEQVKLYFVLDKIADTEKIALDEAAVEKRLQDLAAQAKRPIEEARRVFEEDLRQSMREAQTIEYLLTSAKLEEEQ